MKNMVYVMALFLFAACSSEGVKYKYRSPVYQDLQSVSQSTKEKRYNKLRQRIERKQQLYTEEYARSDNQHQQTLVKLSKDYIHKVLVDTIFPYWYDTRWDYNGTTETPGRGHVACGYFVTTTLQHAGFRIERARLAQQASSKIITTICGKGKTHIIGNNDTEQLKAYMLNQPNGLYIIGLDNHVGFLHKLDGEVWVVHSNGISGSLQVVKERLMSCKLVKRSNAYYVGSIPAHDNLYKRWIKKERIPTITS